MSRHMFNNLKIFYQYYKNDRENAHIYGPIFGTTTLLHLLYVASTEKKEDIYVVKKYYFTQNGYTNFMLVDNNGRHFNVNNSFWYWKWDSIEDWTNVELQEKMCVTYYGYRIPELGIFPNIIGFYK